MKIPEQIVNKLHDLVLFAALDEKEIVQKAYRIMIKKRYYLRCVRDYLTLFKNNSIIE